MAPTLVTRPPLSDGSIDPPSSEEEHGGGGGSEWVVLTKARDDIDAHLLAGRLAELGIEVRTVKDRTVPGAWLYGGSNPWAPVAVLVRRNRLDDARFVLIAIAETRPQQNLHNAHNGVPQRTRRPVVWATALLLGVTLGAIALSQPLRAVTVCHVPGICADR